MFGRLFSFWGCLFSGAMLVLLKGQQLHPKRTETSSFQTISKRRSSGEVVEKQSGPTLIVISPKLYKQNP